MLITVESFNSVATLNEAKHVRDAAQSAYGELKADGCPSDDKVARMGQLRGWIEALKSKIRFFETFGIDPEAANSPKQAIGGQKFSQHDEICDAVAQLSPEQIAKIREAFGKESAKESFWIGAAHSTTALEEIAVSAIN